MSNMIELVTKALVDSDTGWGSDYNVMAQAAIKAMRKPTVVMGRAAHEAEAITPLEVWQSMIDAALEEQDHEKTDL